MDISEIYIKMCDHPKIQGQWELPPRNGDNYYLRNTAYVNHGANTNTYLKAEYVDDAVWLPRQDQIQEMFDTEGYLALLRELEYWMSNEGNQAVSGREVPTGDKDGTVYIVDSCDSFEQLWLAFYMYDMHGLIFTDGKWRAIRGDQDG